MTPGSPMESLRRRHMTNQTYRGQPGVQAGQTLPMRSLAGNPNKPVPGKVHIFWEGQQILQSLHRRFVLCGASQIYGGDFAKFCGLLRIYELYISGHFRNFLEHILISWMEKHLNAIVMCIIAFDWSKMFAVSTKFSVWTILRFDQGCRKWLIDILPKIFQNCCLRFLTAKPFH